MKPIAWLVLGWIACIAWSDVSFAADQFTFIGDIPAICPITIETHNAQLPTGFHITPQEAVKSASEHSWVKCNSKLQQQVYVDSVNYYIIKSAFGPISKESEAVLVNGISGLVSISNKSADNLDPMPPWNYQELVSRALGGVSPDKVKSVRLLAWHTQEDGRPLRFDAALVWMHLAPTPTSDRWVLEILARHPLDADNEWVPSYQGHQWSPIAAFDKPPTNKDVYQFIDGHWDFNPDSSIEEGTKHVNGHWIPIRVAGFSILAGAVRTRTWLNVIGEMPVKFHSGEIPSSK